MNVLYLAIHDLQYPRNKLIRDALERRGHTVMTIDRTIRFGYVHGTLEMLRGMLRKSRKRADVIILSELALQYALHARLIAWLMRAELVVDAFVGMYETNVEDWEQFDRSSLRARTYRSFDKIAARVADVVLSDTEIRAEGWKRMGARRVVVVPVGAPDWATPSAMPSGGPLKVLYYGNYIPLHGLDCVAQSFQHIDTNREIEWTFIGEGSERRRIEEAVLAQAQESKATFLGSVAPERLADYIHGSHVVLGIFGRSPKAAGVIANKVWQGLAAGRYVVTRDSDALDELAGLPDDQLIRVRAADPAGLASALTGLADRHSRGLLESFPETRAFIDEYVRGRAEGVMDVIVGATPPVTVSQ